MRGPNWLYDPSLMKCAFQGQVALTVEEHGFAWRPARAEEHRPDVVAVEQAIGRRATGQRHGRGEQIHRRAERHDDAGTDAAGPPGHHGDPHAAFPCRALARPKQTGRSAVRLV
jgi:hypothetical protein